MMRSCLSCQSTVTDGDMFCGSCGSPVRDESQARDAPIHPPVRGVSTWPSLAPSPASVPPESVKSLVADADRRFSLADVGLNPTSHPLLNGRYRRKLMSRLVIGILPVVVLLPVAVGSAGVGPILGTGALLVIALLNAFLCLGLPVRVTVARWERVFGYQAQAGQEVLNSWIQAIRRHDIPVVPTGEALLTPDHASRAEYVGETFRVAIYCRAYGRDLRVGWITVTDARPYRVITGGMSPGLAGRESSAAAARALSDAIHNSMIEALDRVIGKEGAGAEPDREIAFNINGQLGSTHIEAEYDDLLEVFSGRDSRTTVTVLDQLDIQVYLADGENHTAVESALNDFIGVLHIEVLGREDPEFGSWFRQMRGKVTSQTPSIEEVVELAVRAAQMKTMLWPQAGIDAAQGDALAKLITSLGAERNAVVQIGSILLVKSNGDLMCRNLTQAELSYLERRPTLIKDPSSILQQLQDASSAVLQTAQEPCSCGSGRPARECHLARS
jgi:hypothetical protein